MGQVYFFCGTQDKLLQMMKNKTILGFHAVQDKTKNRLKKGLKQVLQWGILYNTYAQNFNLGKYIEGSLVLIVNLKW